MTADRIPGHPAGEYAPGQPLDAWPPGSIQDVLVRNSVHAIVVTDTTARIILWNEAAERLYRVPAEVALGRLLPELIDSVDLTGQPTDRVAVRAALLATGLWQGRILHRVMTGPIVGRNVIVDVTVSVVSGRDGAPIGALTTHREVTATTRLEAELAALGSLVVEAGRARTREEVAVAALELLCRATGADAGLVTAIDGGYAAIGSLGVQPRTIEVILAYGQLGGALGEALQAIDAYISADVATAPIPEDVREAVLADGIRHLIIVGLRVAGRQTGILGLGWRHQKPDEPSSSIVLQAAAVIASSIENARLLDAVEQGLAAERLLTRRMRALVELTRLPEAVGEDATAWERIVREIGSEVAADATVIGLRSGNQLTLAATNGAEASWARRLMDRPIDTVPIVSRLAAGGQATIVSLDSGDVTEAARGALVAAGFQAMAALAVREEGELVGVVFALFRRTIDKLEIDVRTLDAIGRVLDISFANRRLREGVVASERRYRELFEGSPDALLVQSIDEVVLDANPAALRLYGDGLIGQPVEHLVVADAASSGGEARPEDGTQYTGVGRRLDGTTFPQEVDLRPIEIAGEQRILAIVRDLTERSQMQAELIQAQKMEAIGILVAGVAHELNNPLASIVAFSQLIRTDPGLTDDLRGQADLLVQEANRTRTIVKNLLDFARQRPPERTPTDLRALVDSVLGLQSYLMSRSRLEVDVDMPADLPFLSVDRSQLQQVLINLTVNAAQAIQELRRSGRIVIAAREVSRAGPRMVRISVADDGPGVDPAMTSRLFMPFATTKQPGAGTGLGLSVSFGIVAGHGGTLRYEANPGGGAVFVIELPVSVPGSEAVTMAREAVAGARPAATARSATEAIPARTVPSAGLAGGRPTRILVLDDESAIRDVLGRVLKRAGYEAILAASGAEALELVAADPPDAILCDHRMAGMDGTEFHAAVMAIAPHLRSRFVFMSGDVLNPELHEFAEAVGAHLLAKPFDIATVGATIAALLSVEAG